MDALKNPSLQKTVLLVPSLKAGRGTGHLRRSLSLAKKIGAFVYVPKEKSLAECDALVKAAVADGLKDFQIIDEPFDKLGAGWDLVCLDLFRATKEEAALFSKLGPVCSIDDGGNFCGESDYLLDVIPSMPRKKKGAEFIANLSSPALIDLPKNRRDSFPEKIKTALVCVSGETREGLSAAAVQALEGLGIKTTEVSSKNPVANLRERLYEYDLVVTHYGFTAFEALAANCAVILLSTSGLHKKLSKKYGFVCLDKNELSARKLGPLLERPELLQNKKFKAALEGEGGASLGLANNSGLAPFVQSLSFGQKFSCPLCGQGGAKVLARTSTHTFCRCKKCGIIYLSFSTDSRVQYEADYFGSEYKAQYGRSYLDDFASIKAQGLRRAKIVRSLLLGRASGEASASGALLDIGCAYGPFLAAAKDLGFAPYGTDISQSALDYVKKDLGFSAVRSNFADFDIKKEFGLEAFDAVTMWYVIEHCQDLKALLPRVNKLLKKGGVFAFSTPSAQGVSGRFNKKTFFEQSPRDHYTVWEPSRAASLLKKFGFKAVKI
ncbi:MAG: class I SAM-dependent methyltransferase, partial [Treponema sp.]|nr:class I SAM-dependent methyltransferase [Treponema sp.]